MYLQSISVMSNLDPKLQHMLERRGRGWKPSATVSTSEGEIAVIVKVSNRDAWFARSEVFGGADIGSFEDGAIVTSRIPLSRVEALHQAPEVISLKPAQPLRPLLRDTIAEIKARVDLLPVNAGGEQGRGVIVGIVDFGCDFAHQNFRNNDGTSRIQAIWDQGAPTSFDSPFGYGKVYRRSEINSALQASNPYTALGYRPARFGEHGTHVMDIVAGNGNGSGTPGVAPNADIVFVQLSASDIPFSGEEVLGSSFGDSVQLLEALKFIFDFAEDNPCVVNLSLGTNGGPHDGSTLVEQGIDALISQQANRAVVIAAANSFADGIHAAGSVQANAFKDLVWQIDQNDTSGKELEIWYDGADSFRVELIDPQGTSLGSILLGHSARIRDQATNAVLFFTAHRQGDPNNGDNTFGIYMDPSAAAALPSSLTIRLHGEVVSDGNFHAWIERDDGDQSHFEAPNDNSCTLGSISCGRLSIVVGSYDAHVIGQPLSYFSSSGPTRDNRKKPEISAPGHQVLAANSCTLTGITRKSGTSMAAPAVAGVIALMLAEASSINIKISIEQIRDILAKTARSGPPNSLWDPRYGLGRVDANAAVQAVRDLLS